MKILKYDSLQLIEIYDGNKDIKLKSIKTDETSYFEDPIFFKFNDSNFLRIHEIVFGTGYFNTEHIYQINMQCQLDTVAFEEASRNPNEYLKPGELILKGEYKNFSDNEITFYFGIWKKDDTNCCPSGGYIKGKYKLINKRDGSKWITSFIAFDVKLVPEF